MPDIDLDRLRKLRRRAESLLHTLVSDLRPFRHTSPENGFLRTPDSAAIPKDVNVTTTCSCVMALALTGSLNEFYGEDALKTAGAIFDSLLAAPWMSSGLSENNAFTTTLVLRTLGFLLQNNALPKDIVRRANAKRWEPHLNITRFPAIAKKLARGRDPLSKILFGLMPNNIQTAVASFVASGTDGPRAKKVVTGELSRLIRTTALYDDDLFSMQRSSKATRAAATTKSDAYSTAHLNRLLLDDFFSNEIAPIRPLSLSKIAKSLASDPKQFGINEYASSAAVIYWFVDGVDRAEMRLPEGEWQTLCEWATEEFGRQRSLVVAKHAAMMDPVAMAMAACLCARLRAISNRGALGMKSRHQAMLPSVTELEQSIVELVGERTKSGIWPKYFPLFHYQEAGSNFCFTFELLEAVLSEFGNKENRLINQPSFVDALELAVTWCERNRLQYSKSKGNARLQFAGWNSGGFLETLRREQPESWATAVVHMFLWELVDVLSRYIQDRVLEKYVATLPSAKAPKLRDMLDISLWMDQQYKSLKRTLSGTIIKSFKTTTARRLRTQPPSGAPLSALLFGPPGTSKTQIAKVIAAELHWPLVQIDPSHFLQSSFQNIYIQAEKVFEDVTDLAGAVVFFDEMDALVQKRDDEQSPIDTESKFLTTFMLPKLAKLHDLGRVVFLMATNFQADFDDAIKRAGRFDLLLCMGPPTLAAKCAGIHVFYGPKEKATTDTKAAGKTILEMCKGDVWLREQLDLYTFGEFKTLVRGISATKSSIRKAVDGLGAIQFRDLVKRDSKTAGLRFDDLQPLLVAYNAKTIRNLDKIEVNFKEHRPDRPVIRYVRDRKESKRQ